MVNFDHRDAGTPESQWSASLHWTTVAQLDPSRIRHLIVVAAHPDDETLGAAGLMHRVVRAGGLVSVLLATDGEASHPLSPTHTAEQLRARRACEVARALALIAPGIPTVRLGLPDGMLKHHADDFRAGLEAAIAASDGPVTLAVPWRGDGHGDHRMVGEISAAVARATGARLLEYPIWLWHWSSPDDPRTPWPDMCTLTLSAEEHAVKQRALAVHTSQTAPLSSAPGDETLLREEFLEHFGRPIEVYVSDEEVPGEPSLPRAYFEALYAGESDPWDFETRWYEHRKRALTMASLPRERFHRALEVGCSIGILTEQLAGRCDHLLATDIAERPLQFARQRLADQPHVEFRQMAAHEEWPRGSFDLIVFSEVGYYLNADELPLVISRAARSLCTGGVLVACHWRHPVRDYPLTGDQVHSLLRAETSLARLLLHEEEDFVLELYSTPPARSVARQTGLV